MKTLSGIPSNSAEFNALSKELVNMEIKNSS
jgi:hypothetical protein